MGKTNTVEKINSIDEQIKKLKARQKRLEKKLHEKIGKAVIDHWGVNDQEKAIEIIELLTPEVKKIIGNENNVDNNN